MQQNKIKKNSSGSVRYMIGNFIHTTMTFAITLKRLL